MPRANRYLAKKYPLVRTILEVQWLVSLLQLLWTLAVILKHVSTTHHGFAGVTQPHASRGSHASFNYHNLLECCQSSVTLIKRNNWKYLKTMLGSSGPLAGIRWGSAQWTRLSRMQLASACAERRSKKQGNIRRSSAECLVVHMYRDNRDISLDSGVIIARYTPSPLHSTKRTGISTINRCKKTNEVTACP